MRDRVLEITEALVALPSWDGESEVQMLLEGLFRDAGFACTRHEVAVGRGNLVALRGTGGPLLCSHADTHPPHDHPDPTTCHLHDGVLTGRGVLDAKGQIAALVAACEATLDAPATVVITCDEEDGGLGSERLQLPAELRPANGGIVLEPTAFRACTAEAGVIELTLSARTVSAHAYATDGVSALDVVLGAVDALEGCRYLDARHPLFDPPTVRLLNLNGGEHPWRKPARASADVGLVLLPETDTTAARAEATEVLDALGAAWRGADVELTYEIRDVCEPFAHAPESLPIVGRLRELLEDDFKLGGMPSWTDAANLHLHHGIACVVFGAGDLTTAHSDREQVHLDDLVRLADVLGRLLAP